MWRPHSPFTRFKIAATLAFGLLAPTGEARADETFSASGPAQCIDLGATQFNSPKQLCVAKVDPNGGNYYLWTSWDATTSPSAVINRASGSAAIPGISQVRTVSKDGIDWLLKDKLTDPKDPHRIASSLPGANEQVEVPVSSELYSCYSVKLEKPACDLVKAGDTNPFRRGTEFCVGPRAGGYHTRVMSPDKPGVWTETDITAQDYAHQVHESPGRPPTFSLPLGGGTELQSVALAGPQADDLDAARATCAPPAPPADTIVVTPPPATEPVQSIEETRNQDATGQCTDCDAGKVPGQLQPDRNRYETVGAVSMARALAPNLPPPVGGDLIPISDLLADPAPSKRNIRHDAHGKPMQSVDDENWGALVSWVNAAFSAHSDSGTNFAELSKLYLSYVTKTKAQGKKPFPMGVLLIPGIENGYGTEGVSSSGGVGIWQILKHYLTGYGLSTVAEAKNTTLSTAAAFNRLQSYQSVCGDDLRCYAAAWVRGHASPNWKKLNQEPRGWEPRLQATRIAALSALVQYVADPANHITNPQTQLKKQGPEQLSASVKLTHGYPEREAFIQYLARQTAPALASQ